MIGKTRRRFLAERYALWAVPLAVLLAAACLGGRASGRWLVLTVSVTGLALLLEHPPLGLVGLVLAALVAQMEFGTGTEVALNSATLLIPVLVAVWLLDMARGRRVHSVPSRTNRPLLLFLLAGLLSLLIGAASWDPAVPRSSSFVLVQLAQWAVFAFSAAAFWLTANLADGQVWVRRLSLSFLVVAGTLASLLVLSQSLHLPALGALLARRATLALHRAPFWMLLSAVTGGQLLFNRELSGLWRGISLAALAATLVYGFYLHRQTASNWVGVVAVLGMLAWLRFPRLRWPAVILLLLLVATGWATAAVYDFAGGDAEWAESGGSRLALITRVIKVTMRNPITGLGPAAYRPYARLEPLPYRRALWLDPQVSSHNNYVDLFSHGGLLGLGLFAWFAIELALLGLRLRKRFTDGFVAGYVNGMLAVWAGSLVLMLFADWILPFVYNIGFPGFQASVLVWLFLGGLVALENMPSQEVAV